MYKQKINESHDCYILAQLQKEMFPLTFIMSLDPLALNYQGVHQALGLPVQLLRNQSLTFDTAVSVTHSLGPLWFTRIKGKVKLKSNFSSIF